MPGYGRINTDGEILEYFRKGGSKKKSKAKKSKKDACYHKAKAKYRVFPSAYASGYIAKCRKRRGKIK
mgnify:CR=1 FL=1|tara:strand:+ start:378 stop:581 length:204 start_codon:yes stop_codon:yes gene_type:complete